MNRRTILTVAATASLCACSAGEPREDVIPAPRSAAVASTVAAVASSVPSVASGAPFDGLVACNDLIRPGEKHFARLWRLSQGVVNAAEGYWSHAGDRIVFQATPEGAACDRIFLTETRGLPAKLISNARGVTTCAYFMPGDKSLLYASTHAFQQDCPPPPDRSSGYVWQVHPEYDIYVHDLGTGRETALTTEYGYDAEATVSPRGDRMVFTSTRSGDLELWTCKLDGTDMKQVTHEPGYDGGAFFSHDGRSLVYRTTRFSPQGTPEGEVERASYRELLARNMVQPGRMDLYVIGADGSGRRRLTDLPGASFAPYFYPDDRRVIFSTNHHESEARNFDLYAIGVDGQRLERITWYKGFDSFPMFSRDGRWLVFASNRGGTQTGETNLFLARYES